MWPHEDHPEITIGRFVPNRNPRNHFAETEQAAFEPSHLVPGVAMSPDKGSEYHVAGETVRSAYELHKSDPAGVFVSRALIVFQA